MARSRRTSGRFGDTNPPVHAWAAWQVYQLDKRTRRGGDHAFLAQAYRAITLDVMWWLNQKDGENRGVFGGGFLGMDNIGVFDRDQPLPTGGMLDQVDGTAWMATLVLQMLEITIELSHHDPGYLRMFGRWVWDGWLIANALEKGAGHVSFWNEETGFYHDVIEFPDGSAQSLEVFSMQSVVPLFACISIPIDAAEALETINDRDQRAAPAYHVPESAARFRAARRRRHSRDDGGGRPGPAGSAAGATTRPRPVPLAARAPVPVEVPRGPSVRVPRERARLQRRVHAGGVAQSDVRRQLQLARADLDADELPVRPGTELLRPLPGRHVHGVGPDGRR